VHENCKFLILSFLR